VALDDIVFSEGDIQTFVVELPLGAGGTLIDILTAEGYASDLLYNEHTLTWPAETDVEDGVDYGNTGAEYTGNVTLPAEAVVKTGEKYGANGTEFTGTYAGGGGGSGAPIIGGHHIIQREG
jgi:hypothetical protein